MTTHDIDDRPIDSITDPDTLLDSGDVSVTEDTAVVDEETVEFVADAPDMAPVGVTTGGETLVMRVTEDCSWKLPSSNVAPEASFAESAREWVRTNTGLDISIESVAGCWRHRLSSRRPTGPRRATSSSSRRHRRSTARHPRCRSTTVPTGLQKPAGSNGFPTTEHESREPACFWTDRGQLTPA
ncbi:hypothetical protein ACFQL1_17350 [Halomicroarcula sp. GCM10025709]|uniref:hypothetical protein n=1 Tax=Halomicroarcula sp. GCM10025709 TaxID=3252669 RepID=UPI003622FB37